MRILYNLDGQAVEVTNEADGVYRVWIDETLIAGEHTTANDAMAAAYWDGIGDQED